MHAVRAAEIMEERERRGSSCVNNPLGSSLWGGWQFGHQLFQMAVQQRMAGTSPSPGYRLRDSAAAFEHRQAVAAQLFAEWYPTSDRLLPTWQGEWVRLPVGSVPRLTAPAVLFPLSCTASHEDDMEEDGPEGMD